MKFSFFIASELTIVLKWTVWSVQINEGWKNCE